MVCLEVREAEAAIRDGQWAHEKEFWTSKLEMARTLFANALPEPRLQFQRTIRSPAIRSSSHVDSRRVNGKQIPLSIQPHVPSFCVFPPMPDTSTRNTDFGKYDGLHSQVSVIWRVTWAISDWKVAAYAALSANSMPLQP